jgi:hypothetical protein
MAVAMVLLKFSDIALGGVGCFESKRRAGKLFIARLGEIFFAAI